MPVIGAYDRYRHKEGRKLKLASLDPNEKVLAEDLDKESSFASFDQMRDELQQLQKMLYAQNKHRVLVVMQAMDTGGKDGCIKPSHLYPSLASPPTPDVYSAHKAFSAIAAAHHLSLIHI